jgi:hypothetical protein
MVTSELICLGNCWKLTAETMKSGAGQKTTIFTNSGNLPVFGASFPIQKLASKMA